MYTQEGERFKGLSMVVRGDTLKSSHPDMFWGNFMSFMYNKNCSVFGVFLKIRHIRFGQLIILIRPLKLKWFYLKSCITFPVWAAQLVARWTGTWKVRGSNLAVANWIFNWRKVAGEILCSMPYNTAAQNRIRNNDVVYSIHTLRAWHSTKISKNANN